jgi:phototropin
VSTSEQTNFSGTSSGRLTDFFGTEVFQMVLHNPTTCHQLTKFAQTRFCGENMGFLEQVRFNRGCEIGSISTDGGTG